MKKILFGLFSLSCLSLGAQTWTREANLPGTTGRYYDAAFVIGNCAYVGCGSNSTSSFDDFYKWDQTTNTWSAIANYPGAGYAYSPISFSIEGKGYVGLGHTGYGVAPYQDLWRYDTGTNTWTQMASLPGPGRYDASVFVIGYKAYVVGGSPGGPPYLSDVWEYNAHTNSWTHLNNYPGGGNDGGVCFSIGNHGYYGGGWDGGSVHNDFWQYDTGTDTWTSMPTLPVPMTEYARSFVIGNTGYVCSGVNGSLHDLGSGYAYNANTNTWSVFTNLSANGLERDHAVAFTIGNYGYTCTGRDSTGAILKDLWRYGQFQLTISQISTDCLHRDLVASVAGGTGFTFQWSTGATTDTLVNADSAKTYRVTAIYAGDTLTDSLALNAYTTLHVSSILANYPECASASNGSASVAVIGGITPYTFLWNNGGTGSSLNGLDSGTYKAMITDAAGCMDSAKTHLNGLVSPIHASVSVINISCFGGNNGSAVVHASNGIYPYSFMWSNSQTDSNATTLTAGLYNITVTDSAGCLAVDTAIIWQPATLLTASVTYTPAQCYGTSNGTATVIPGGGNAPYTYNWTSGQQTATITGLSVGTYSVTVLDSNGCSINRIDTVTQPKNTLDSIHICMVTVDTASTHNIIIWNSTGLNNIDSIKILFFNSASQWQVIGEVLVSADQFTDTNSINNPNMNTVRYCIIGVDSCGNEELVSASPWQNTIHITYQSGGTFDWAGTGYLVQNDPLPVLTYVLYRDNNSTGNWIAIDSVSGTQNTMTDPNFSNYPNGRWYVQARLNISGCSSAGDRIESGSFTASRSNQKKSSALGIQQLTGIQADVSLYPNPNNGVFEVSYSNLPDNGKAELKITDVLGRTIDSHSLSNRMNKINMNESNLQNGIYYYQVVCANQIISSGKFIIVK
jgi:hypothetical protein